MMAKTDADFNLDFEVLKPLQEDAIRIADGTWDSYHDKLQQCERLFEAAVMAVVEMGNCSYQRHLNQEQANAIKPSLAMMEVTGICYVWRSGDKAQPKVEYWRDGTFNALEELRTKDFYC